MEKTNTLLSNSYSKNKKLIRNDFEFLKKIIDQTNLDKDNIKIVNLELKMISLTPGVYDLVDKNNTTKLSDSDFELSIQLDTISMKSVLTTSNNIHSNYELNTFLGFKNTGYSKELKKQKNQL